MHVIVNCTRDRLNETLEEPSPVLKLTDFDESYSAFYLDKIVTNFRGLKVPTRFRRAPS